MLRTHKKKTFLSVNIKTKALKLFASGEREKSNFSSIKCDVICTPKARKPCAVHVANNNQLNKLKEQKFETAAPYTVN